MGHLPMDAGARAAGQLGDELYESSMRRERMQTEQGMEMRMLQGGGF